MSICDTPLTGTLLPPIFWSGAQICPEAQTAGDGVGVTPAQAEGTPALSPMETDPFRQHLGCVWSLQPYPSGLQHRSIWGCLCSLRIIHVQVSGAVTQPLASAGLEALHGSLLSGGLSWGSAGLWVTLVEKDGTPSRGG